MHRQVYNTRDWRELPRDGDCVVAFLFGGHGGACAGHIGRHHVDPDDPYSRTVQVCARHHRHLETALRHLDKRPDWKRCPHNGAHRYPGAREACERRLNGVPATA